MRRSKQLNRGNRSTLAVFLAAAIIGVACASDGASAPTHLMIVNYVGTARDSVEWQVNASSPGQASLTDSLGNVLMVPMNATIDTSDLGHIGGRIHIVVSGPRFGSFPDSMPPCIVAGSVDQFGCQTTAAGVLIYDEHSIGWPHQAVGFVPDTVWVTVSGRIIGDSAVGTITVKQHDQGTIMDSVALQPVSVDVHRGPATTSFVLH